MTEPDDKGNGGRFVTRYEWMEHIRRYEVERLEQKRQMDEICTGLKQLQRQWDRTAGPIVFLLVLLGAIATISSILNTVILWVR